MKGGIAIELVIAILGSSATAAFVSGIFSLIVNRKKKDDGLEAGVRILLYDRIKHLSIKYCELGSITEDEYEDLQRMHSVYHNDLGGNGYLDDAMSRVAKLPHTR